MTGRSFQARLRAADTTTPLVRIPHLKSLFYYFLVLLHVANYFSSQIPLWLNILIHSDWTYLNQEDIWLCLLLNPKIYRYHSDPLAWFIYSLSKVPFFWKSSSFYAKKKWINPYEHKLIIQRSICEKIEVKIKNPINRIWQHARPRWRSTLYAIFYLMLTCNMVKNWLLLL